MLKAELGDFLYYIIFAVVIIAGLLEKVAKSKRQQQQAGTPQPHDEFEDVDEQPSQRQAAPQTLEDIMKRMMETIETPEPKKVSHPEVVYSSAMDTEEAQSSEYIPTPGRHFHHSEEARKREKTGRISYTPIVIEEEKKVSELPEYEFEFDIRQAVISSEILNRKY